MKARCPSCGHVIETEELILCDEEVDEFALAEEDLDRATMEIPKTTMSKKIKI